MKKLCECGCGEPAPIATRNRAERGQMRGEPVRFIRGHTPRKRFCKRGHDTWDVGRIGPGGETGSCRKCARIQADKWAKDHPEWVRAKARRRQESGRAAEQVRRYQATPKGQIAVLLAEINRGQIPSTLRITKVRQMVTEELNARVS